MRYKWQDDSKHYYGINEIGKQKIKRRIDGVHKLKRNKMEKQKKKFLHCRVDTWSSDDFLMLVPFMNWAIGIGTILIKNVVKRN